VCTDEHQYRDEWAGLTGRAPSDVYVPAAFRDHDTGRITDVEAGTLLFYIEHAGVTHKLTVQVQSAGPGRMSGVVTDDEVMG
jgi:hypothetical protein